MTGSICDFISYKYFSELYTNQLPPPNSKIQTSPIVLQTTSTIN